MRRILLAAAMLLVSSQAHGQTFESLIAQANAAEESHRNHAARELFERAYRISGLDPTLLALASLDAIKAGEHQAGFALLQRTMREGFLREDFIAQLERDSAYAAFRNLPVWASVIADAHRRIARVDTALRSELLRIAEEDQKNRNGIEAFVERVGIKSAAGDSATRALRAADEPLTRRVRAIIAERGWPRRDLVGDDGAHAAWLVVQHAPSTVQRELLPLLRAAARNGQARTSDLALLEDRVLVAEGKRQRFGSQMRSSATAGPPTLEPIENEACVDRRRAAVGLEPLAEYLRRFRVSYSPPAHGCKTSP